ncbi:MAG: division/cell wall cluster transcriptional repressor MraZ [Blastocatellia bacterium AA13]|nr:MAG: division/cell wall cluster transcriptional repressor MraZ [Blastocatellia bacterium AA13]
MLRGNSKVRIDEKGRIKIPTSYRRHIEENYGNEFYVTSLTGDSARIYPMKEWLLIEEKLRAKGTMDKAVRKFLDRTNYYGQVVEMDSQGRVLIHPLLRTSAHLVSDVAVLGYLHYLEVWSMDHFKQRLESEPYTEEDEASIAQLGI